MHQFGKDVLLYIRVKVERYKKLESKSFDMNLLQLLTLFNLKVKIFFFFQFNKWSLFFNLYVMKRKNICVMVMLKESWNKYWKPLFWNPYNYFYDITSWNTWCGPSPWWMTFKWTSDLYDFISLTSFYLNLYFFIKKLQKIKHWIESIWFLVFYFLSNLIFRIYA